MNPLTPLAVRIGALSWLPRYLRQITAIDKAIQRLSGGRLSLLMLAGLPNLMLLVPGRRSGVHRSTPLLCVPRGSAYLIAGSNFGAAKFPVWVHNLRAAAHPRIRVGRLMHEVQVRELEGATRETAWATMVQTWPNYAKYAERTQRVIPVFELTPVESAA